MIRFSGKEDRVIACSHASKENCPTCQYEGKCKIMGKLDVMMDIEIDRLYGKEKVIFT